MAWRTDSHPGDERHADHRGGDEVAGAKPLSFSGSVARWWRRIWQTVANDSHFEQRYAGRIAAVGVAVLLSAALAGILAVLNTDRLVAYQTRALQVRAGALGLGTQIAQLDADERGWLLTGDERFLASLNGAEQHLTAAIDSLAPLLVDDAQHDDLMRIRDAGRNRIRETLSQVAAAREGRRDDAIQALSQAVPDGQALHAMLGRFVDANLESLEHFGAEYRASTRRLLLVVLSAALAILFFGLHQVGSTYRFVREVSGHRRRLRDANADLERQVTARTAELASAVARFEVALRGADVFVFAQDRDLRFTFASHGLLGGLPGDVVGLRDADVLPAELQPPILAMKRKVLASGEPTVTELAMPDPQGQPRRVRLRLEALREDGEGINGVIGCAVDVTREREAHDRLTSVTTELRTVVQRFEVALESADITVFAQDGELRYSWLSSGLFGIVPDTLLGRTDDDALAPDMARRLAEVKRDVLASDERRTLEMRSSVNGEDRWYAVGIEPHHDTAGGVVGLLGSALDITERRARETHNRILLRELTHRTKNLLAVVQAMARQTLTTTASARDFEQRFSGRLQALASSLDILLSENWEGASVSELIRSQLSHYKEFVGWRIHFDGPDLRLEPEAAQNLGLALHELCVNSSKFGALSGEAGRIDVTWELSSEPQDPTFRIRWAETGGPIVEPPLRKGFGYAVLERLVPRSVSGRSTLEHRPEGVVWTLDMPAHFVRSLGETGVPLKIWTG